MDTVSGSVHNGAGTVELEYEHTRQRLLLSDLGHRANLQLSFLVNDEEQLKYLPADVIELSLKRLLMLSPFELLGRRGFGRTKLQRLYACLSRVWDDLEEAQLSADDEERVVVGEPESDPDSEIEVMLQRTPVADDQSAAQIHEQLVQDLQHVGLWRQPVGRALSSMRECTWHIGGTTFEKLMATYSAEELLSMKEGRLKAVGELLRQVASICAIALRLELSVDLTSSRIAIARDTIRKYLHERHSPDKTELRSEVLEPLLEQLAIDGGDLCATVTRHRLGLSAVGRTLGNIAEEVDVSRERVRQLLARAREVISIRWREGEYLFDDLCELLQRSDDGFDSYVLCWRVFECLYPDRVTHRRATSPGEIAGRQREASERAGSSHRTVSSRVGKAATDLLHPEIEQALSGDTAAIGMKRSP